MKIAPLCLLFLIPSVAVAQDWPQAAGPNGDFVTGGNAPTDFSVALDRNVVWISELPSTGQGTPIIVGDKVFVTSHATISEDTELGKEILGLCFEAKTGRELWRREIPGTRITDLSSLFSDNTAASPVADRRSVCFVNVGGTAACFDHRGEKRWQHVWTPFGRHHARQHEPMMHDGKVILMFAPRYDLPVSATTKPGAKKYGRTKDVWTWLQAFDVQSGDRIWTAKSPTSVHSTSILRKTADGKSAIVTGRGGGHQPPEEPYGVSMIDADTGDTIWDRPIKRYYATQNESWNNELACSFVGKTHLTLDAKTGKPISNVSLSDNVTVCRPIDGKYERQSGQSLASTKKSVTNQSNLLVGDYHYFRAHGDYLIGRVHIRTGKVEYLEVPVQVVRRPGVPDETRSRDAIPNDMKNADGFRATQDPRNARDGWGHVSAASPIVVGDYLYMPTMIGMVYVLKWNDDSLDEQSLVSISDLGPAGETWSLSSLSYSNGKLYARTLKHLICIGANE